MFTFPINQYSPYEGLQMITTWNTENLGGTGSATKIILLPMTAGNSVDWGDGTIDNLNTHTYVSGGVKTVKIYGFIKDWAFTDLGDKLKITDISNTGGLSLMGSGFYGCANMTWTATGAPAVPVIGAMSSTFRDCALFNGDISGWDTSSLTGINAMLQGCTIFNQDVSGWDVSGVSLFNSAFRDCAALNPNIGGWNTSSGTAMQSMVRDTLFNRDISGWDVSGVTNMANMMNGSSFSTTNYDLLLPAWEAQSVQNTVTAHFGTATYGAGTPATARAALIADHTWTITDGGPT